MEVGPEIKFDFLTNFTLEMKLEDFDEFFEIRVVDVSTEIPQTLSRIEIDYQALAFAPSHHQISFGTKQAHLATLSYDFQFAEV